MRRALLVAAVLLSACGSAVTSTPRVTIVPATAAPIQAPHFIEVPAAVSKAAAAQNGDGWTQVIAFDEVGLPPGETVSYEVTGSATANYACNSTTVLDQVNQQVVTAAVSATATFTADASDEVTGVIKVYPPAPRSSACPAGYAIGIWRINYDNMKLLDRSNQVSESVPGMGVQAQ